MSEFIKLSNPAGIAKPTGYSHVAEITGGRLVLISGQVPFDQAGNIVGVGDLGAQAEQVFANIKIALESVGATFENVAKFTYFVTDISQMEAVRTVRNKYINTANPPASSAVEVRKLFREGIMLEVELMAVIP